ncbi:MAG: DUF2249 domain-containing protein [Actinobacteria bacterium]|nr:DUF2249 domain-containing protein [Actinomycetota bacterium]
MTSSLADTPVNVASGPAEAEAVEAVVEHHARMSGELLALVQNVLAEATRGQVSAGTRTALVDYARDELLTHAAAEERTIYPAGASLPELRALITAMTREHEELADLVGQLEHAKMAGDVAAAAGALWTLFRVHLAKENDLVVPRLAADPQVSLAELVSGLHELTGPEVSCGAAGGCGCGHEPDHGVPSLDVRTIPHAIRHATVFGALEAVPSGGALHLVAPHAPVPLLKQIEDRHPGAFSVSYVEEGPEVWQLELRRRG